MKLCYFDDYRLGMVRDDIVIDVSSTLSEVKARNQQDLMATLIADFAIFKPRLEALTSGAGTPLSKVQLRAPLPAPRTIVCMAVNYDDGLIVSPHVNAFHKTPNAIIGPDEKMVLPDVPASVFEGEAEMAIVIGKRTENVSPEEAMDHVFGYTNFIDGSARDLLPTTNSFFQMKSRRTFAPTGPYIVTRDEIADPQNLNIRLWVNGELKQDFNTAKMVTNIRNSIAWVSAIQTLEAGDMIATGTDHCGLNAFQHGDLVELETQGLGRLRIRVQDDLKRTWSRETRIERHKKGLKTIAPQLSGKYTSEQSVVNS
ncbi:fumarylacetoacetate hydrolase family protein [Bradyrhizobium sp. WYCCWR 13022]|uniref:fumarylacetoacetate hydrolase family protein n=1 Tax=unclassified Bradyrhizobium TaxID=2631580 RepID=UPI00263B2457|nr:fumarylacetoacetate hydrolase family protein [Bradyrhizobium sp. WYCCWR 13022]MDN4984310.1 fumarylacetoacetate hydrolase family protein [Bradyrhizobium sp. WYCCWR 13022]